MSTATTRTGTLGELTRRQAATVRANWTTVTQHLAPPTVAWTWCESGLSERVKHYLKHHGLIERAPWDQDRWRTTPDLWMYVIDTADDDEDVGREAEGQEPLPGTADRTQRRESRTHPAAAHHSRRQGRAEQVTLTGDEPPDEGPVVENVERNLRKDPTRPTGRERAAQHPSQARLGAWCAVQDIDADRDEWLGPVARDEPALLLPAD